MRVLSQHNQQPRGLVATGILAGTTAGTNVDAAGANWAQIGCRTIALLLLSCENVLGALLEVKESRVQSLPSRRGGFLT